MGSHRLGAERSQGSDRSEHTHVAGCAACLRFLYILLGLESQQEKEKPGDLRPEREIVIREWGIT